MRRPISLVLLTSLACAAPAARNAAPVAPVAQSSARVADSLALLRLHQRGREAHLAKRADWLVAGQADTLISVSRGGVSATPRQRVQANFQPYLDASTFQAWDDIVPPRIRISPDGQMAYVIVQKRVHLTARDSTGATVPERTRYAWMTVYEKKEGSWKLAAIASTDRPDSVSAGAKEE